MERETEQHIENIKQEKTNLKEKEMVAEEKAKIEKPEIEVKVDEVEKEDKKNVKKIEPNRGEKKTEALVNGKSLHISTKHAIAVCDFIRRKNVEKAIADLEDVKKMKFAIPMKGEIPHKKGIMSGRYPINAIKEFIKLLKSLKSNAIANDLELEKVRIFCKANVASRPYRRFGRKRFKRTHVEIKLVPMVKKAKKKSGGKK